MDGNLFATRSLEMADYCLKFVHLSLLSLVVAVIATTNTVEQAIDATPNDETYFEKLTDANFAR